MRRKRMNWFKYKWKKLTYFYYDLICFLQSLPAWIIVIWGDRDWDFAYLIKIIMFKLNKMQNVMKDGYHIGDDLRARKMREVINHFEHYFNIEKYMEPCPDNKRVDEYGNAVSIDDLEKYLNTPITPEYRRWINKNYILEQWHLHEGFRKINKHINHWWC